MENEQLLHLIVITHKMNEYVKIEHFEINADTAGSFWSVGRH